MIKITKGKPLRVSALWHEGLGVVRTKVIFRDYKGQQTAYWMDREVYNSIPLMKDVGVKDFQKFGKVDRALNTDIYSNL